MGFIIQLVKAAILPFFWLWLAFIVWVDNSNILEHVRFFLMLMAFFVIFQLIALVPSWMIYRGAVNRRVNDATARNRPVPGMAQGLHSRLLDMGFRRLGESDTALPGRRETISWLYCNADGSIHAELVAVMGAAVQFNTLFADQAILETSYPFGENLTRENYRSVRVSTGIVPALERHIEIGRAMILEHGQPIVVDNMATYLAWDRRYRELYTKSGKLGASFRRNVFNVFSGAYAIGWLALWGLLIEVQGEATAALVVLMAILTLPPLLWIFRK